MNPLLQLAEHGQSLWIDYLRRQFIERGDLARMIQRDGLKGLTSNPAIFHKAITGSDDYDDDIRTLAGYPGAHALTVYEALAVEDIRQAADVMWPVYEQTEGADGFVSIEVSPHLAPSVEGTCAEARRLWNTLDRRNVMIKVPATPAGIMAMRQLIAEGININMTLIFALDMYEAVARSYIEALEQRVAAGLDISAISSVASFFISRIDTAVEQLIDNPPAAEPEQVARYSALEPVRGRVGIANAKLAYQKFLALFNGDRWQALAYRGAHPQRLLWASTSTKNPRFRDTLYVEELIGPNTVNTAPPATIDAFRDHGQARPSLLEDIGQAQAVMEHFTSLGIPFSPITDNLLGDGIRLFADAHDALLNSVRETLETLR